MTPTQNRDIIETPGQGVDVVEVKPAVNAAFVQNTQAITALPRFDKVKHLLSDKPLRRPNRSAPLPT